MISSAVAMPIDVASLLPKVCSIADTCEQPELSYAIFSCPVTAADTSHHKTVPAGLMDGLFPRLTHGDLHDLPAVWERMSSSCNHDSAAREGLVEVLRWVERQHVLVLSMYGSS